MGRNFDLIKKNLISLGYIVNCFEIENRTILLQNQLEIEKSQEKARDNNKLKVR